MGSRVWDFVFLLLLTLVAVAIHGYHYGAQDQFVYIPAIKHHLDGGLYPFDSAFFHLETRFMLFDELVAFSIRATGLSVRWAVFFWHIASLFLLLAGCLAVSRRCFRERSAQWAATVAVAVMLTLAVAGTMLFLADEYLHPRTIATGALLFAVAAVLDRSWRALPWLGFAVLIHPTMAAAGALHLVFLAWPRGKWKPSLAGVVPSFALATGNEAWREVLSLRWFLFPLRWPWYAWLGVAIPMALLAWFARLGRRAGNETVTHLSQRLLWSGAAGVVAGVAVSITPGFERLIPAEPMRTLHLFTILTLLLAGGLAGQHLLRNRPARWAAAFLPFAAAMFVAQSYVLYPDSPHIEWPGRTVENGWVKAFEWVRHNTPRDAYFALGPTYQEAEGQDFHSFRALAERSSLADYSKDRGAAGISPELAPIWREQVRDRENWGRFVAADFRRLKQKYGVTWVVLQAARAPGFGTSLDCPYRNQTVAVCRIR